MHESKVPETELQGASIDESTGKISKAGQAIGVMVEGEAVRGFATPSRKLEFFSPTMSDWKWREYTTPAYIQTHVYWRERNPKKGEFILVPTFRLPTLVHTRSGNAKWLYEISHTNPLWIHPKDADRLQIQNGDLVRVNTDIGYYVVRAWLTEGIKPGVVACSHHLGRWRLKKEAGTDRWASALVDLQELGGGKWMMRQLEGITPFASDDPDSERVWWHESGVNQNLTFPVHPDPISGMHCWHQAVRIEKSQVDDRYGDIVVDTNRSHELYKEWLKKTRPAPGPDGLRRPLWFARAVRPATETYFIKAANDDDEKE